MPKSAKICISSLGCAKNLVDTEVMLGSLAQSGVTLTNDLKHADIFVINTCSFIDGAREESNEAIRDAIRWKKKKRHRKVVVAGCLPQRMPEETKETHPNVDLFLGLDEVANVGTMVQNLLRKIPTINTFIKEDLPVYLYDEQTPRLLVTPSHYAYIKISEGCNHKCSFCAIPTFRGKLRSRTVTSITKEAQALLNQGVKEIILVSQDSTGYGSDLQDGSSIAQLLRALDKLQAKEYWVRLLYLYPTTVTDDLVEAFATSSHLCKYIDMPLQHASDRVLKTMRRGITKKRTEDLLQKFRDRIPGVTMRTTLLVGHPGEAEEDFETLRDFVLQQKFDRVGIFTYSHEQNTHAFSMSEYASKEEAGKRRDELMKVQHEISYANNQRFVGQEIKVIIDDVFEDEEGQTRCIGRSEGDAPDVDNQVHFAYHEKIADSVFATVKIYEAEAYDLFGEVVN